jgi:hypothetical protein
MPSGGGDSMGEAPGAGASGGDEGRAPLTRRTLLRRAGLGAATVLVVGAGAVGYRAYDNGVFSTGDGAAYDPWRIWQERRGTPLGMVAAAILAANAHNAQAWLFRVSDARIDLFADRARGTGALDPFRREMLVSLGCAIENCVIAGRAGGFAARVTLRPDAARPLHVARIDLRRTQPVVTELYAQIPERHSSRDGYAVGRAVAAQAMTTMSGLGADDLAAVRVIWFTSEAERRRVGDLMVAAAAAVVADHDQARANDTWFRQDWDEVQRLRDGLTIDASGLSDLVAAMAKLLPAQPDSSLDSAWVSGTRDRQVATAAAFGIVAVPDAGDDAQRLRGGRLLQRIHLWATKEGISLQHMNQLTERADRERELGIPPRFGDALRELVPAGLEALSAFRIGYAGEPAAPSPRRALESVVVT